MHHVPLPLPNLLFWWMASSWLPHPWLPNRHQLLAIGLQSFCSLSYQAPTTLHGGWECTFRACEEIFLSLLSPSWSVLPITVRPMVLQCERVVFTVGSVQLFMIWPLPNFALFLSARSPVTSLLLNPMVTSLSSIYLTFSSTGQVNHSFFYSSILFTKNF